MYLLKKVFELCPSVGTAIDVAALNQGNINQWITGRSMETLTMRRLTFCFLFVTLVGCGADWIVPASPHATIPVVINVPGTDAGVDNPCDGGQPLAPDDAGTPVVDAGNPVVDAGTPEVDAGTPVVDAGVPDTDGGLVCQPGYGYGDDNHCHSGPPGLDAGEPDAGSVGFCRWLKNDEKECCKPGYGWGDKNHCHIHKEIPGKGGN